MESSWHSFDASVAVEDSEAMAQLLGVQYSGNEQKQPTPTTAMYWSGQEADQYYGSAPYYMQMQMQQTNSGASCYDQAGYYGSNTFTMTGDFFMSEAEQMAADPSFMFDLNLDFECEGTGTGHGGGGNTPAVCKRRLVEDQKGESTTCTVPKKKSRSTAVPVSSMP